MDTDNIRKIRREYIDLYSDVKSQWDADQSYYDDTFMVDVKAPHKVIRSGLGRRIVDAPSEQLVTSNPQAFFNVIKGREAIGDRLGEEANNWFAFLKRENPNPLKESVKNKLLLGVNYIRLSHNEKWVTGKKEEREHARQFSLPLIFLIPDARVVMASPEEDEEGIPRRVIVEYERQEIDVLARYPNWSRPSGKRGMVKWMEYYDKDTFHCEADEVVVRHEENIYKLTPFIRSYSGFGRRSPDGNMASLIVGDLRFIRDLLKEECSMRSDISSVFHLFSHKPITLTVPSGTNIDKKKLAREFSLGAYDFNVIALPEGSQFLGDTVMRFEQPSTEAFAYLAEVQARIERYAPMIMAGFPYGTSGRQQDVSSMAAMRRYDTVLDNTETEWAKALEMGFRVISKVPTLRNGTRLQKNDSDAIFRCEVKLRAKDPIEEDRKATLGSRLLQNGEIDPMTNLIDFKGYTKEKSRQILIDKLKWKVILESPEIAQLIGTRAAEKAGMLDDLQKVRAQGSGVQPLEQGLPPSQAQRMMGEVQTPYGHEEASMRGARVPPERYSR